MQMQKRRKKKISSGHENKMLRLSVRVVADELAVALIELATTVFSSALHPVSSSLATR